VLKISVSGTGTVQVRAVFSNLDGDLFPGQFVRVIVHRITLPNAIVVPKQSISQGPQGPFVYDLSAA
jgi:multidrug efflux pump subunit AcrA (membrane-fusion protein)